MDFSAKDILKILPHRSPFLLLDKVTDCVPGKSAVGIKNVTIDEPCFNGHFPTEPIFPGALTIEVIAQTIAVMYAADFIEDLKEGESLESVASHIGYLVSANVKFLAPIVPGDVMHVRVRHKVTTQNLMSVDVVVEIDGNIAAKGSLGVSMKK